VSPEVGPGLRRDRWRGRNDLLPRLGDVDGISRVGSVGVHRLRSTPGRTTSKQQVVSWYTADRDFPDVPEV
jgi:hypothetical protein